MLMPRCHPGIGRGTGRLLSAARRIAVLSFFSLLIVAPAFPQSAGGARASASPRPNPLSAKSAPHPDKARAESAFQDARRDEQAGDWKSAFAKYSEAVAYAPSNQQYSTLKEHARFQWIQGIVAAAERQVIAGNVPGARALLTEALTIDPNYSVARERLAELKSDAVEDAPDKEQRLAGLPRISPKPGTREFDFRGTVRDAYAEVGQQFGVTMAFEGDVPNRVIRFRTPKVDFDTAVMVLSRQTNTFTRVVDRHTLFVVNDTPQNERQYAPEVEKSLLLPSSVTSDEMNEAVRMVREMTGITRTQLDLSSRTLTLRSTEQNVALAEALLRQIEQPHGEVTLEIEILEVDRTTALQLGVTPPTGSTLLALTPSDIAQLKAAQNNGTLLSVVQSIFGSTGALAATAGSAPVLPPLIAFGGGKSIFLATVPGASANFGEALSTIRSAQRILLRAQDGKPATFFVGDRYPVSLGLLSSDLGSSTTALSAALQAGLTLPRVDFTVGTSPVGVALGDFNGDGHLDMVTANHGDGTTDGTISILLGIGDGTFATQTQITIPGGALSSAPSAVAVGDFDGDGILDIAVTDSANNDVMILYGDGQGNFAAPTAATTYATGPNPVALLAIDLNSGSYVSGSPIPDLAVVNQGDGVAAGTVSVLINDTTGNRTNIFATRVDYPVGVSPKGIAYGDFNGDGRPDLVVTNSTDGTVSVLLQQNDGTTATLGTFAASVPYDTGTAPAGVTVADFNQDAHADLAVANQGASPGTVSILLGNGDGTFSAHTEYSTGSSPTGVLAADFTGEGNPDLAVTDQADNTLDILIGNGDGTFNAPISLPTGNSPVAVVAADLNGDGTNDAVVANESSGSVTVTLNTIQSDVSNPAGQTAYPSADYIDLGLKIKATPRLHSDDEVTLHLEFDIKSLAGASVNGIPVLSNRSIDQTVRLHENETSILSGIVQANEAQIISGLPWTSTVPSVGDLTGNNSTNNQDTELLIVITPRAMRLPPHDMPALYAGHGEPSTPAGSVPGTPLPPVIQPGQPEPTPGGNRPVQPSGPGPQFGQPPTRPGQFGMQPTVPPGGGDNQPRTEP